MSQKLENLTEATTISILDILYSVRSPGSSPVSRKINFGNFKNALNQYTVYADTFAGADMGAQINAAYAALPSTGGIIIVPGGNYSHATPIVCNTLDKPVLLRGAPAGGTILTFTGTGHSAAVTLNMTKAITSGYGIRDIKLVGPGSLGTTAGLILGGLGADDGKGFAGGTLQNVHVRGFGCNIVIGNNTFMLTMDNCTSNFGGKLLFEKGGAGAGATDWSVNGTNTINSGENMRVVNCCFADANNQQGGLSTARYAVHLQLSGLCDWNFVGTSFDDAELYIDKTGGTGNNIHLTNCHFENPAGDSIATYNFITTLTAQTNVTLSLINCQFVQDANTSAPTAFIFASGTIHAFGCTCVRNSSTTVPAFVVFTDTGASNIFNWAGMRTRNSAYTNVVASVGTATSGWATGDGAYSLVSERGVATFSNTNSVLDATTFAGSDIGAKINAAYAFAVAASLKGTIITVPAGALSYSTPIVFGTDGCRVSLRGAPGGATRLTFTGASGTKGLTINTGCQSAAAEHSSFEAVRDITFIGNNTSTSTPQVGIYAGGANGAAHAILMNCNIEGFGQGLVLGANTYHFSYQNGTIRNCGQNVFINTASNSGESIHFINAFVVDVAGNAPANGFQVADYGCASLIINGGSIDDCQLAIGLQVNVTMMGVHMENPGQATWGKYTYITVADSSYSEITLVGCVLMNDATTNRPDQFMTTNGANVTLVGCCLFNNSGSVVPTLINGGRATWLGLNNTSGAVTNIIGGWPFSRSGTTEPTVPHTAGTFANLPTGIEGMMQPITDSTTATWGATITGGGSNHVLAYFDGTNWTVAAK